MAGRLGAGGSDGFSDGGARWLGGTGCGVRAGRVVAEPVWVAAC